MKNKTIVLGEISSTQRIALKLGDSSSTLLKEYRKDSSSDWITSKGIEIPDTMVPVLIQKLMDK